MTEWMSPNAPPGRRSAPLAVVADASAQVHRHPASGQVASLDVGELWHYRDLLWTLVWRDIVVRYKQTFLGIAWALLVPIFTATVYVIVFGKFANFPTAERRTRASSWPACCRCSTSLRR